MSASQIDPKGTAGLCEKLQRLHSGVSLLPCGGLGQWLRWGKGPQALGSEATRMLCTDWLTFLPVGTQGTHEATAPSSHLQQKAVATSTNQAGRTGKGREEVTSWRLRVCAFCRSSAHKGHRQADAHLFPCGDQTSGC